MSGAQDARVLRRMCLALQSQIERSQLTPFWRLSEWRDRALLRAEVALKKRERDARDEEIERLNVSDSHLEVSLECPPNIGFLDISDVSGCYWVSRSVVAGKA